MGCKQLQLSDYFRFVGNESDIQYSEYQNIKFRPTEFNGNQIGTSFSWTDPPGVLGTVNITTSTIYNAAGQVTSTIDPEGNTSSTLYNAIGKPYQTTDKLGNVSTTVYDDRGNVIESQSPDGTISRTIGGKHMFCVLFPH